MKTVNTYLIRKPSDLEEVIHMSRTYPHRAREVRVTEVIELTPEQYQKIAQNPLRNFEFLKGKGGYDADGYCTVVELICEGKQTLYADPEGSSYCRYLGIKIGD